MKVRSVKIDDQLWDRLKRYAHLNDLSAGEFIRQAAKEKMGRDTKAQAMLAAEIASTSASEPPK